MHFTYACRHADVIKQPRPIHTLSDDGNLHRMEQRTNESINFNTQTYTHTMWLYIQ